MALSFKTVLWILAVCPRFNDEDSSLVTVDCWLYAGTQLGVTVIKLCATTQYIPDPHEVSSDTYLTSYVPGAQISSAGATAEVPSSSIGIGTHAFGLKTAVVFTVEA